MTKDLGLHFWEAFPAHIPQTNDPAKIRAIKDQLEAAGVQLSGYGVVHLSSDEAANRKLFEFAKAMGLGYLSVDPDPESFDLLDKLVEEYDVPIGIHNHGPGHRFALIDTIASAIKNHSPKIGCCIDTGHFLRSKEDPVHAVEVFGKRVYGVHLKDVKNAETLPSWAKGISASPISSRLWPPASIPIASRSSTRESRKTRRTTSRSASLKFMK